MKPSETYHDGKDPRPVSIDFIFKRFQFCGLWIHGALEMD